MPNKLWSRLGCLLAACLAGSVAWGYDILRNEDGALVTYDSGSIAMQIKLGTDTVLDDGTNFSTSVEAAMAAWNPEVGAVQFQGTIVASGPAGDGNHINEIVFSDTIFGEAFGANTLAVTMSWVTVSPRVDGTYRRTQSDILFNTAKTWNSYRGAHRYGGPYDIRRVAIHELGHVLGLDHPDEAVPPQSVTAIMNSTISNVDAIQPDDRAGAQFLYGPGSGTVTRPANDNFAAAFAVNLVNNAFSWAANNYGGTKEAGEPNHAPDEPGGASVWWKWTAPGPGSMTITTAGSYFDTLLAAYTGSAVNALSQIASNDDVQSAVIRTSSITFPTTTGTTYYIAVDGWEAESGTISLNLTFTPEVVNSAPVITGHPSNQTVSIGQSAQFTVSATGTPALAYRWQRLPAGSVTWGDLYDGGNFTGTGSTTMSVSGTTLALNGDQFRCFISNSVGNAISNIGQLFVYTPVFPPVITLQPVNRSVGEGQSVQFNAAASGSPAPGYQWQRLPYGSSTWIDLGNGGSFSGTTTGTLTVGSTTLLMNGDQFRCVASNSSGTVISNTVTLTVIQIHPPVITTEPQAQTVVEGGFASFTVAASSGSPVTYNWQVLQPDVGNWANLANGTDYGGVMTSMLTISSVPIDFMGNSYRCQVTNADGATMSAAVVLTVTPTAPVITNRSPARQVLNAGQPLSLEITAAGTGPIAYEWVHNGRPVTNATDRISVPSVSWQDSGWYVVSVTDSKGTRRSTPWFVIIAPAQTQVRTWGGENAGNHVSAPENLRDAVSLSSNIQHTLAIRRGGTVVGWGYNDSNITNIPAGLTDVVTVAAGRTHSVALKSDSTVAVWGGGAQPPAGLKDVVAIAAGDYFTIALKSNGSVVAWGSNSYGVTTVPSGLNNVVAIAAGGYSAFALKRDGTVRAWGENYTVPENAIDLSTIAACNGYSLGVKNDGSIHRLGYSRSNIILPSQITDVIAIGAGYYDFFALHSDGRISWWGDANYGAGPPPEDVADVFAIAAGWGFAAALRDITHATAPEILAHPSNLSIAETLTATFTVSVTGAGPFSYQWRKNGVNLSGATSAALSLKNLKFSDAGNYDVVVTNFIGSSVSNSATLIVNPIPVVTSLSPSRHVVQFGQSLDLYVTATGTGPLSYQWLHNGRAVNGATSSNYTRTNLRRQESGWYVVLITDNFGTRRSAPIFVTVTPTLSWVVAWGANAYGETTIPIGLNNVCTLAAGGSHALAVKSDGTVIGWGANNYGQSNVPAGLGNVVAVAAGGSFSAALMADGTVAAWGNNDYGQCNVPAGLDNIVSLVAGTYHILALRSDGTVVAWGRNDGQQSLVPEGLSGVVALTANAYRSQAVKVDGTAVIWGQHFGNNPPADLGNVASAALGQDHGLVLKLDGSVQTWGYNGYGQTNVPIDEKNVVAIGAGSSCSVLLKENGTVLVYGLDYSGGTPRPASLTNVYDIATGQSFCLGLASTNLPPTVDVQPRNLTVFQNAAANFYVLASGASPIVYQWQHLPAGSETWSAISNTGPYNGATNSGLTINSTLLSMNGDRYRCLITNAAGMATSEAVVLTVITPLPVITMQPVGQGLLLGNIAALTVSSVSPVPQSYQWQKDGADIIGATSMTLSFPNFQIGDVGSYRVVVTNSAGSVTSNEAIMVLAEAPWITGHPQPQTVYVGEAVTFTVTATSNAALAYVWRKEGEPIAGATLSNYTIASVQLADAGTYSVVVTNVAGSDTSSPATLTVNASTAPVITLQPQSKTVAMAAPTSFSVAAAGAPAPSYRWQRLPAGGGGWADVDPGINQAYGGVTTPTLILYVGTLNGNHGDQFRCVVSNVAGTVVSEVATLSISSSIAPVTAAGGYSFGQYVDGNGVLHAMGRNQEGQLGDGTSTPHLLPVTSASQVVFSEAGSDHGLYVKQDGTLWTKGYNEYGAIGDGSGTSKYTAVQIASNVAAASAGHRHTLYRRNDGTLWAAGWNQYGQLGDGSTVTRLSPVQIATHVVGADASYYHSVFVRGDGTAWAMGYNGLGQFGNGGIESSLTPVAIAANVRSVAAGTYHTLLLKTDGTLWSTGYNASGQLGDGSMVNRLSPVQVASQVNAVAAGFTHSLFLKADGTLWGMGANDRGQLGDGSLLNRPAPVQIASGVTTVAAGLLHTYFTKADGTLWACGANDQGQLGDGSTTDRPSPVLIASGALGLPLDLTHATASNSSAADRVSLTWNPARGAIQYQIGRSSTNDPATATIIADRVDGTYYEDLTGVAGQTYYYWVRAVGGEGTLGFGAAATGRYGMTVVSPAITTQPQSQAAAIGGSVNFTVTATGTAPLSYQWRKGANPISAATTATFPLGSVVPADAGDYDVVISNAAGLVTSDVATLTITKLAQTISFTGPLSQPYNVTPITLTASASSGLPVSFGLISGPASLVGNQLTLSGVGLVTVRASQPGDTSYDPAPDVDCSFAVTANFGSWGLAQFTSGELNNVSISGPNADPDDDGYANLVEYALGLEPKAISLSGLPEVTTDATHWIYTYTRPEGRTDVTIAVEVSTDLSGWGEPTVTAVLVSASGGVETWQAKQLLTSANAFFRLKVSQ